MPVIVPNTNDFTDYPKYYIKKPADPLLVISLSQAKWMKNVITDGDDAVINNTDVPEFGNGSTPVTNKPSDPEATRSNDSDDTGTSTDASVVSTDTTAWANLNDQLRVELGRAQGGLWKESDGPNQNAITINKTIVWARHNPLSLPGKGIPWCSSFISWVLDQAGIQAPRTASSQYWRNYGTEVGIRNWEDARMNDIIVFRYNNGLGHVGFYRGYNKTTNRVNILGGNQGDDLNIKSFSTGKVVAIKRNWTVPTAFDKPNYITVDAPSGGSYEDTR